MADQEWYEYESNEQSGRKRLAPKPPPPPLRRASAQARRLPWLLLIFLMCVAITAAVGLPVGLGVMAGLRDRDELIRTSAEDHYQRALTYEAENYTDLALAELQLALRYNPNYQPARQKLIEMQNKLSPVGTPGPGSVAEQLFKQGNEAVKKEDWDDAISAFEEVRSVDPNFQKSAVTGALFQAYVGGGKRAVTAGNIELARERFESALTLQPNDVFVKQQRDMARAYLAAQQNVGYDWGIAASNFQTVYQQDPNYYDVKRQLTNALLANGDLAAKRGAWCIAAREYERANQISPSQNLAANVAQANTNCVAAVLNPTPTPTLTPNPTLSPVANIVPRNIVIGEEIFAAQKSVDTNVQCSGLGVITGKVTDNANRPLGGVMVMYDNLQGAAATAKTNPDGTYSFILGKDAGKFYVAVMLPDGKTTQSNIVEVEYPGGLAKGCRIVVDWTRIK